MVTLYVGSLWHQDCDPFVSVVGFDESEVEAKLDGLQQEEYRRIANEADDTAENEINIMSSGVYAELSAFVIDNMMDGKDMTTYQELLRDGIVVV